MRCHDFLIQQICFIQKENGGGLLKINGCDNSLEQVEALKHSVLKQQMGKIITNSTKEPVEAAKQMDKWTKNGNKIRLERTTFSFS